VTAADKHRYDTDVVDALAQRVVVGDARWAPSCRRPISRSTTSATGVDAVETKYVRLQSG